MKKLVLYIYAMLKELLWGSGIPVEVSPIGSGYFLRAGVLSRDIDKAYYWAFGEGWQQMLLKESPHRWNALHPDLPVIYGHDAIDKTMEMIACEYIKVVLRES